LEVEPISLILCCSGGMRQSTVLLLMRSPCCVQYEGALRVQQQQQVTAIECLTKSIVYHYSFPSCLRDLYSLCLRCSLCVDSVCLSCSHYKQTVARSTSFLILIAPHFRQAFCLVLIFIRDDMPTQPSHLFFSFLPYKTCGDTGVPSHVGCHSCHSMPCRNALV